MTLKEACQQTGKSESTLRRWIRTKKLKATLSDGKYDIDDASIESLVNPSPEKETTEPATATTVTDQMTKQIDSQGGEIAFLRQELSDQSKRHDAILLQMTQQLDRAHLQLEDLHGEPPIESLEQQPSFWQRLKALLIDAY